MFLLQIDEATNGMFTQVAEIRSGASGERKNNLVKLMRLLHAINSGSLQVGSNAIKVRTGGVRATSTLTFTDDPAADGTFSLLGKTFTGRASGASGEFEWNITTGGTAAADAAANAASVVTKINACTDVKISGNVTAASTDGVVTITSLTPGTVGNGYVLTESLTNCTAADFTGGTETGNKDF